MTYPQPPYPPQGQPGYPPQGQPGYAQPQQPYPPQMQPQPAYGPPQPPQQAYYQQPPVAYGPPQGYAQPQQPGYPPQPQQAAARATLGEFMEQPSMGGGSATSKFFTKSRPQNSWLQMQVTRDLLASDVHHQENDGVLQYFKTGGQPDFNRPKFVLVIPTQVVGSSDQASSQAVFPDGACAIWLKGLTRDALLQGMAQAGIPQPDKVLAAGKIGGAVITMISAGTRPARTAQYSDTNLFNFTYVPGGREHEAFQQPEHQQLQEIAQAASGFPAAAPAAAITVSPPAAPPQPPATAPGPAPYAQSPTGYPMDANGTITYAQQLPPTAAAPTIAPPAPPATAPYATPPAPSAPQGYQPYPGSPEIPGQGMVPQEQVAHYGQPQAGYAPPQQFQQDANQVLQAPPPGMGYPQQPQQAPGQPPAPPMPPAPPGGAPAMTPEMAATLARLGGHGL